MPKCNLPEVPVQEGISFTDFRTVTNADMDDIIKQSKLKTCSLDPIPVKVMSSCVETLTPVIVNIINASTSKGFVPNNMKQAVVSPLLKKASLDHEVLSNYRPVSNLTFVSKMLERTVANQLNSYLTQHNLLDPFQAAYMKRHSTETTLVRVTNDILRALDRGNEAVLVLLDLSAAFDTIDHCVLVQRLRDRYGISGTALEWLMSHLCDRAQSVIIGSSKSSATPLKFGVPQGSVLGPLLFSLYVGPIGDLLRKYGIDYMCYADDTQLYLTFDAQAAATSVVKLEHCVRDIQAWMCENKLKLNEGKTEVIHFNSKFRSSEPIQSIVIGTTFVDACESARNLGVILDSSMTMANQLCSLSRSATNSLRYIGRLRKYLDEDSTKKLVNAFVISKLDYCNSLYYGLPDTSLYCLERLQNTAARIVTKTKRHEHITPILQNLHWLPIKYRLLFKILLLAYKCVHNLAPSYLSELLTVRNPGRALRSNSDTLLAVPKNSDIKTRFYGERSFSSCAPKLWNHLPSRIQSSPSIGAFKRNLKTYLFTCAFNSS